MIRLAAPAGRTPEREYAARVVLGEFLGLEYELVPGDRVEISDGTRRLRLGDELFAASAWLEVGSLPRTPLARLDVAELGARTVERELPVLYGTPTLRIDADEIELGLDVFGAAFFMLTRYEELVRTARDEHGRIPVELTLAHQEGFLQRPIVNEYVEVLWAALQRLWPRLERRTRVFRILPSHDVDEPLCAGRSPKRALKAAAGDVVVRRNPRLALKRARAFATRSRDADPCNTFDYLMDESERRGLKSAFYFMAERTGDPRDGTYELDEPWIEALLQRIHARGHEIGLHPTYHSYRDPELTRRQADRLRAACERLGIHQESWGGRQHWLRWENPTTWQNWEDAELAYDSSLNFDDGHGFRAGTCYEYPVFNLRTRQELKLRERPLVVMEVALIEVVKYPAAQVLTEVERLKERCRLFDGDFTLLWHNNWLLSRGQRRLYEAALSAT